MAAHFAEKFSSQYNLDLFSRKKSALRLVQACEKAKKVLSTNNLAVLSVECIMEDRDLSYQVKRQEFEEMIQDLAQKVLEPVHEALKSAKLTPDDICCVEFVGGSSRVQLVQKLVSDMFGASKISGTLNRDEAVARGCAIRGAMISPLVKVRNYTIEDWNRVPVEVYWDYMYAPRNSRKAATSQLLRTVAFPVGNAVPSTKILTIYRTAEDEDEVEPDGTYKFEMFVSYPDDSNQKYGIPLLPSNIIGKYVISGIKKYQENAKKVALKVQLKLESDGLFVVTSVYQTEDVVRMVPDEKAETHPTSNGVSDPASSPSDAKEPTPQANGVSDSSKKAASDESSEQKSEGESTQKQESEVKMKEVVVPVKHNLTVSIQMGFIPSETVSKYVEVEMALRKIDQLVVETAEMRNAVEEYIYNTRSNLSSAWKNFVMEGEAPRLLEALKKAEDWLYDAGMDATLNEYRSQLEILKKDGDTIKARYDEDQERKRLALEKERLEAERLAREAEEAAKKLKEQKEEALKETSGPEIQEEVVEDETQGNQPECSAGGEMEISEPSD